MCESASQEQPNQTLSLILSTLFMIYIVMAMLHERAGHVILSASSPFLGVLMTCCSFRNKATPLVGLKR